MQSFQLPTNPRVQMLPANVGATCFQQSFWCLHGVMKQRLPKYSMASNFQIASHIVLTVDNQNFCRAIFFKYHIYRLDNSKAHEKRQKISSSSHVSKAVNISYMVIRYQLSSPKNHLCRCLNPTFLVQIVQSVDKSVDQYISSSFHCPSSRWSSRLGMDPYFTIKCWRCVYWQNAIH